MRSLYRRVEWPDGGGFVEGSAVNFGCDGVACQEFGRDFWEHEHARWIGREPAFLAAERKEEPLTAPTSEPKLTVKQEKFVNALSIAREIDGRLRLDEDKSASIGVDQNVINRRLCFEAQEGRARRS